MCMRSPPSSRVIRRRRACDLAHLVVGHGRCTSEAAAAKTAAELKAAVDTQLEAVVEVASKLGSALPVRPASGSRLPADLLELLPSPMYTLAIGLSANVCALRPDDTALSIVGDAAAARALATKGSGGGGGTHSGRRRT